jgi:hypothetical protein
VNRCKGKGGNVMENEEPKLEWHKMKSQYVAIKGDMIVCIVEPAEGLACEAWRIQPVAGLYTTIEAAKEGAEKAHAQYLANHPEDGKPQDNLYLDLLRGVVAALEAKYKKP